MSNEKLKNASCDDCIYKFNYDTEVDFDTVRTSYCNRWPGVLIECDIMLLKKPMNINILVTHDSLCSATKLTHFSCNHSRFDGRWHNFCPTCGMERQFVLTEGGE